jgi:hypothetical protein
MLAGHPLVGLLEQGTNPTLQHLEISTSQTKMFSLTIMSWSLTQLTRLLLSSTLAWCSSTWSQPVKRGFLTHYGGPCCRVHLYAVVENLTDWNDAITGATTNSLRAGVVVQDDGREAASARS